MIEFADFAMLDGWALLILVLATCGAVAIGSGRTRVRFALHVATAD